MAEPETTLWTGHPSQVTNLKAYLVSGGVGLASIGLAFVHPVLFLVIVFPGIYAGWKWLQVKCHRYELTTQRFRTTSGVLNRTTDDLELYRIKDTSFVEPFFLRLFGLGNVILMTSDRSSPELEINAVADAKELREKLRVQVEALRDKKGVREVDFE